MDIKKSRKSVLYILKHCSARIKHG